MKTSGKSKFIIISLLVIFASVALLAGCGQKPVTQEGAKYKLKLATQLPESQPAWLLRLVCMLKRLMRRSKGEIEITVFNNGTLGQERDLVEGMKLGTIDMANVNGALMTVLRRVWQVI